MKEPLLPLETHETAIASLEKAEHTFRLALDKLARKGKREFSQPGEDYAIHKQLLKLCLRVAAQGERLERAQKAAKKN